MFRFGRMAVARVVVDANNEYARCVQRRLSKYHGDYMLLRRNGQSRDFIEGTLGTRATVIWLSLLDTYRCRSKRTHDMFMEEVHDTYIVNMVDIANAQGLTRLKDVIPQHIHSAYLIALPASEWSQTPMELRVVFFHGPGWRDTVSRNLWYFLLDDLFCMDTTLQVRTWN